MQDISLHLLDLVQNSVAAEADCIQLVLSEDPDSGSLTILVEDNGRGMNEAQTARATDPFYTTRTTRKVGLGIPLFQAAAALTGGHLSIRSAPGKGTQLLALFHSNHIDCLPLGSMSETMAALILCNPSIEFVYRHQYKDQTFTLDTREIKAQLGEVPIDHPDVISFIRQYVEEGINELYGGV